MPRAAADTPGTAPMEAPRLGDELLRPLPLLAVGIFALNNLALKSAMPGLFTGKLSDVAVCFFMPLYVSALLAVRFSSTPRWRRTALGAFLTAAVLGAINLSAAASRAHDVVLGALASLARLTPAPNVVDPTDLWALPMTLAAVLYARHLDSNSEAHRHE